MGTGNFNGGGGGGGGGGNLAMDWHPIQGEKKIILLVASCHKNWDKPQPDGPLGSFANFISLQVLLNNHDHQQGIH